MNRALSKSAVNTRLSINPATNTEAAGVAVNAVASQKPENALRLTKRHYPGRGLARSDRKPSGLTKAVAIYKAVSTPAWATGP